MSNQAPNLTLVDLRNLLQVVDFAADQGAFKGWTTINQVKDIRDKLDLFLKAAQAAEQTNAQSEVNDAPEAVDDIISFDEEEEKEEKPVKKSKAKK